MNGFCSHFIRIAFFLKFGIVNFKTSERDVGCNDIKLG